MLRILKFNNFLRCCTQPKFFAVDAKQNTNDILDKYTEADQEKILKSLNNLSLKEILW